jgi:hypothetical protein
MNEGISFYTILITAVFILVVSSLAALAWLFNDLAWLLNDYDDDLPVYKDDEYEDYNDRTG